MLVQVVDYQAILKFRKKRHNSRDSGEGLVGEFRASFERDKHENFWKLNEKTASFWRSFLDEKWKMRDMISFANA